MAPFLFIICLNYIMNDHTSNFFLKWLHTKKKRQEADNIHSDNSDDLVLLADIHSLTESLLHNLKQEAWDIGLYMNSNKTEFVF